MSMAKKDYSKRIQERWNRRVASGEVKSQQVMQQFKRDYKAIGYATQILARFLGRG